MLLGGDELVVVDDGDGDAGRTGRLSRKLEGYTRPLTSMSKRTDRQGRAPATY
jgi:hypothetical protein